MKLFMIVSGEEFANDISTLLNENDLHATEIGSSGDFLQYGNVVYLLGVDDNKSQFVITLFQDTKRTGNTNPFHNEVSLFMLDVDGYHKINP